MPNYELKKSIEVTKLSLRTGIPMGALPVTIPFGAVIENPELDYDYGKFTFLGQRYRCASDILKAAMESHPVGAPAAPSAAAPAPVAPAAAAEPASSPTEVEGLQWEKLGSSPYLVERAKVPGGWLVKVDQSVAFYPDPKHRWNGTSLA
ncbi:MAG: hypothetical protein ACLQGV_11875 [Bryobacteraceae bacterium]